MNDQDISNILAMTNRPLRNYIVPGLTSWMVGDGSSLGCVRLFESERDQQRDIAPHSHRFDFTCLVLRGQVVNKLWGHDAFGDEFEMSRITYLGAPGAYKKEAVQRGRFSYAAHTYIAGDFYRMKSDEIHSIVFSRGALVLFFEGPPSTNESFMLDPVSDGEVIATSDTSPWMFKKASQIDDHFA